eukprot:TRINITY_DN1204_c0_g1_i3.p1 TRINITY_DN1204_c0_g1~~TRINITY_DN1204_c0_g1_i3.p1  ORF type:complete len:867 (-),score=238.14 TRINITY_DN1204_c0_g1_i3:45-2645(-)
MKKGTVSVAIPDSKPMKRGTSSPKVPSATLVPTHGTAPASGASPASNVAVDDKYFLSTRYHNKGVVASVREFLNVQIKYLAELRIINKSFIQPIQRAFGSLAYQQQHQMHHQPVLTYGQSPPDASVPPSNPSSSSSKKELFLQKTRGVRSVTSGSGGTTHASKPVTQVDLLSDFQTLTATLLSINKALAQQFERKIESIGLNTCVCTVNDILSATVDSLQAYGPYPDAYMDAVAFLDANRDSKDFQDFLSSVVLPAGFEAQTFKTFLHKPLHFINNYSLLLQELLVYTDDKAEEMSSLLVTKETLNLCLKSIHKRLLTRKNIRRVTQLSDAFIGVLDRHFFLPTRRLLYETACWKLKHHHHRIVDAASLIHTAKIRSKQISKRIDVRLFLFSDLIMLAKPKKVTFSGERESYRLQTSLSLAKTVYIDLEDTEAFRNVIELRELNQTGNDLRVFLCTDSQEKKHRILKELRKSIENLYASSSAAFGPSASVNANVSLPAHRTVKEELVSLKKDLVRAHAKIELQKQQTSELSNKLVKYRRKGKRKRRMLAFYADKYGPIDESQLLLLGNNSSSGNNNSSNNISSNSRSDTQPQPISGPLNLHRHRRSVSAGSSSELGLFQLDITEPPPSEKQQQQQQQHSQQQQSQQHRLTVKSTKSRHKRSSSTGDTTEEDDDDIDPSARQRRRKSRYSSNSNSNGTDFAQPPRRRATTATPSPSPASASTPATATATAASTITATLQPTTTATTVTTATDPSSSSAETIGGDASSSSSSSGSGGGVELVIIPSQPHQPAQQVTVHPPSPSATTAAQMLLGNNSSNNSTPGGGSSVATSVETDKEAQKQLLQRIQEMKKEKQGAKGTPSEVKYWIV